MKFFAVSALAALCLGSVPAAAAIVTLDLNATVEGTAPTGFPTLTFEDIAADTVRLTADASGLSGSEFIRAIFFNYSGAPGPISFTFDDPMSSGPAAQNIYQTLNGRNTPGNNGLYDIELAFRTSNAGGGINRFNADEVVIYTLTAAGLDSLDFNVISAPEGPMNVQRFALARVQGIATGEGSASVADNDGGTITPDPEPVPAPAALGLFGLGALALGFARRR